MAASAPSTSIQYNREVAGGAEKIDGDQHGSLEYYQATWTCTTAGDATAYPIGLLPAGRITIIPQLSTYFADDAGANADLDFGYGAYVEEDGTAVVADPNGWGDSVDIATGPVCGTWGVAATFKEPTTYNSRAGIPITISTDSGDVDIGDEIIIGVAYIKHG